MSDETKLSQEAAKGSRARQLLENEVLQEAFKKLEDDYVQFWRNSTADNGQGREKAYIAINVIGKVKQHLEAIMANGKLAQAELNALYAADERKKRFGII